MPRSQGRVITNARIGTIVVVREPRWHTHQVEMAELLLVIAAVLAACVLWAVLVTSRRGTAPTARLVLWLGAIGPFVATVSKSVDDVASGLTSLDLVRGGLPVVCYFTARMIHHPPRIPWGLVERALAVYLAVTIASTAWSVSPNTTLLKAVVLVFAYLNVLELRRHYRTREAVVAGVAGAVHALLLLAIIQLPLRGDDRMGLLYPRVAANLFALIAVAGILLVLIGVGPKWTRRLDVRLILGAVYFFELLATRTRTALALAIAVTVLALVRAARHTAWPAIMACFAVPIATLALLPRADAVVEFLLRDETEHSIGTLTGRTVIWDIGIDAWQQSPLTGLGYYAGHRLGLTLPGNYSNLDSTWIESLVDVGLLGTVPLAIFVLGGVLRASRPGVDSRVTIFTITFALYGLGVSFVNPTVQDANSTMLLLGLILLAPAPKHPNGQLNVGVPAAAAAVEAVSDGPKRKPRTKPVRPFYGDGMNDMRPSCSAVVELLTQVSRS